MGRKVSFSGLLKLKRLIDQTKQFINIGYMLNRFAISKRDASYCKKGKGSFYIAQYAVRWTAQSASHFLPSLIDLFIPTPFSASPGSILARQQIRAKTKSLTFPPLSIARYSFMQLSEQGCL